MFDLWNASDDRGALVGEPGFVPLRRPAAATEHEIRQALLLRLVRGEERLPERIADAILSPRVSR